MARWLPDDDPAEYVRGVLDSPNFLPRYALADVLQGLLDVGDPNSLCAVAQVLDDHIHLVAPRSRGRDG